MFGIQIRESIHLTVPGEPVERLHRDWMDRQARNYSRPYWPGGRTMRGRPAPLRVEPLTYMHVPQVPSPNLIRAGDVFYGHPVTVQRFMAALERHVSAVKTQVESAVDRALLYGGF